MLVYKFDEKGIYTGAEETELDPLESELQGKEIYLLPPNATFDAPEKKEGFAPIWNGVKWEQVEDHRGTKYWLPEDKHGDPAREMKELSSLPEGASFTEPEPTDEELAIKVRAERNMKIAETDYYIMSDYPSNPQNLEELKVYRQALRDLPKQEGFPRDVRWPDVPKFLCKDSESKPLGLAKVGI